jgi:hypothetical protein
LDENDTKFLMKKRFVATPATKTEVSSPIWLQPKYEKKQPWSVLLELSTPHSLSPPNMDYAV